MVGWYFSASGVYISHGDGVLGGSGGSRWSAYENKAEYTATSVAWVGRGCFLGHLIIWAGVVRQKTAKKKKTIKSKV